MSSGTISAEELRDVLDDIYELLLRKNADYGDAWRKYDVAGILLRLSDKTLRFENLYDADGNMRRALVVDESWADTLMDMAGYAIMGLVLKSRERDAE